MSVAAVLQERALASYLRHARATSRVSISSPGAVGESAIVTLWHEWLLCVLAAAHGMPGVAVYVLDQRGMEGSVRLVRRLGYPVILGRRDNAYGVREARQWLRQKDRILAVTLDGPSGPRRVAKPGVVRLARLSRVPLRGLDVSARSALRLDSWDRCVLPAIGGSIELRVQGAVSAAASATDAAISLEKAMNADSRREHVDERRVLRTRVRQAPAAVWARLCTMPLQYGAVSVYPRSP